MYSAFKRALGNLGSWVAKTSIITAFMFGGIGLYFVHSSKQKVKGAICIEVSPNEGDNEDLSPFSDLHGGCKDTKPVGLQILREHTVNEHLQNEIEEKETAAGQTPSPVVYPF